MMFKRLWVAFVIASILGIAVINASMKPVSAAPIFSVYIDPDTNIHAPFTQFNVTIKVAAVPKLWGWEFNITWNPTLLTYYTWDVGGFLKSAGETFFIADLSGAFTKGWIYFSETRTGGTAQASGYGDLAIVGLEVKSGASGQCAIHFLEGFTILLRLDAGGDLETIPASEYELKDGSFKYPYSSPLPGDVNQDGKIDIMDLARIGVKYGQTGGAGWIPEDVVQDGVINIFDLATTARNYGKYA